MVIVPQSSLVHAQQFAFSLNPSQNHVIAKPGATIILPYILTNTGDPTVMKLQVYLLTSNDSTGSYELIPYNSDVPDFPQFTTSDVTLKIDEPFLISSREAVEFDLIMKSNENIAEGDYYFTLVAETEPTEGFGDTSSLILESGIGSNIYLSITKDGRLQTNGEITQFTVQPQYSFRFGNKEIAFFDSFEPVPVLLTVANKGKRVLQASGTITVQPKLNSETTVIPISKQYILANSQRLITGTSSESIKTSDSNTAILPGTFMGSYTAQANLQIGDDTEQSNVSIQYYVFPFTYTVAFILFMILFFLSSLILKSIKK